MLIVLYHDNKTTECFRTYNFEIKNGKIRFRTDKSEFPQIVDFQRIEFLENDYYWKEEVLNIYLKEDDFYQ